MACSSGRGANAALPPVPAMASTKPIVTAACIGVATADGGSASEHERSGGQQSAPDHDYHDVVLNGASAPRATVRAGTGPAEDTDGVRL